MTRILKNSKKIASLIKKIDKIRDVKKLKTITLQENRQQSIIEPLRRFTEP